MKKAKEKVIAALMASPELEALVGDRIYYQYPPEPSSYPLITYKQVAATGDRADGRLYFGKPRLEIRIWGGDTEEIAEAIYPIMDSVGAIFVSEIDLWDSPTLQNTKAIDYRVPVKL